MNKVRWGIISSAAIGLNKVIPALQKGRYCDVTALASRDLEQARKATAKLGIATAYGHYEDLLSDPNIDAVYNPLPNHMHVPWSIKALQAGKHVLCEKPIALDAKEAQTLLDEAAKHPHLKVMEAFMYRFHPQWLRAKALVDEGAIGTLKTVQTFFSYFNDNPHNIRNMVNIGGGGLMDIGCYPISQARFLFGAEPLRVCGLFDIDPTFRTDRSATAILEFAGGTATFTCSTQLSPFQRVQIGGTKGRIEIEIPVNAPPDQRCRIWLRQGDEMKEESFDICDQYTLQGDAFARAILDDQPVPTPLTDALANMQVIDALVASNTQRSWVAIP
jgi:predicted dehydrogenase